MNKRDYYSILGVSPSATPEAIKKAYRSLAIKYHPDKNPGNRIAEERFKEASEAYSVLMNSQKRANYDQSGRRANSTDFNDFTKGFGASVNDVFEDIFNEFFSGGSKQRETADKNGDDLKYNLEISFEEAALGAKTKIRITRKETCRSCVGSGAIKGTNPIICNVCNGSGKIKIHQGFFAINQDCSHCKGDGKIIRDPCPNCYGSGLIDVHRVLSLKVPAGVESGQKLRLPGEGSHGANGGPSGDLIVSISVREHSFFVREGYDIHCEIPISFILAALGGEIEVPSLKKKVKLKILEGTQSGQIYRLKGKGIAKTHGSGHGDLLVKVVVKIPTRLSSRQKELLEEFALISGDSFKPLKKNFFRNLKDFLQS